MTEPRGAEREKPRYPLLEALLRWRLLVFAVLGATLLAGGWPKLTRDNDWYFFSWGGELLFGHGTTLVRSEFIARPDLPGGLHIYASYPFLQIGPPALVLGRLLDIGPKHGILLAGAFVQALGLLFLALLDRTYPPRSACTRWAAFAGGVIVTLAWSLLAHYRHLDDALTLVGTAAALLYVQRKMPYLAGIMLGIAAASKPWGVALLPIALAFDAVSARVRAASAAMVTVLLCWGPFLLVDHGTINVGKHLPYLAPDGPLYALGVRSISEGMPIRLAQFVGGALVATWLVLRRQPALAPLAAFSLRLLMEPGSYLYYPTAVLAAAYVADCSSRHRRPWWTAASAAAWAAAQLSSGHVAGLIRLTTYAGLLLAVLGASARPLRRSRPA